MHKLLHFSRLALIPFAVVLLISGCGDPDRARLIGTWEISGGDGYMNRADPQQAQDEEMEDLPPRVVLKFYRSGSLETQTRIGGQISTKSGHWELKSFDEPSATAVISCNLTDQTTKHEVVFEKPDKIKLVPPNMAGLTRKLIFVRK